METIYSLSQYWQAGFPNVQGWVNADLHEFVAHLGAVQATLEVKGNVAEIGVYHGKFFIALSCLLDASAKAVCIDVFDDQSKNLDGAGEGNLSILKENVARYGRSDIAYEFIKADSIAMTPADKLKLMTDHGPFRLFSVDGCHTTEHTHNDLLTAQDAISPSGVIILDDYMQPHWPGVTEAVHLLYGRTVPRVRPFLYTCHKLFFCGVGWHANYCRAFHERFASHQNARLIRMFGSDVLTVYP